MFIDACSVVYFGDVKNMTTIKEELEKSYRRSCLEGEVYLWQLYIMEHPEHKETYQNAIGDNLNKLKNLRRKNNEMFEL